MVADDGCWVQRGDLLVRLGPGGVELTVDVTGLTLLAADGSDAWLSAAPFVAADAVQLPVDRLVQVHADGSRREIALDRPVHGRAVAEDTGLRLQIALAPPTAVPTGLTNHAHDHHQAVVLVPWADLDVDRVAVSAARQVPWEAPPRHISWLRDSGAGWWVGDQVGPGR